MVSISRLGKRFMIFVFIVMTLLGSCNTLNFSNEEKCIYYKCLASPWSKYEYQMLKINSDKTFIYFNCNYLLSGLGTTICNTIDGKWDRKGDTIILNSNFQYKDFVRCISEFEYKDSIKIRYINYTDRKPIVNFNDLIFRSDSNFYFFESITDSNGIMIIPCQGYEIENYGRYLTNKPNIESLSNVQELQCGYCYEIIKADCIPIIFENKMFKLKYSSIVEILNSYDTLSYPDKYIKINM